jgi:hypothetical protein
MVSGSSCCLSPTPQVSKWAFFCTRPPPQPPAFPGIPHPKPGFNFTRLLGTRPLATTRATHSGTIDAVPHNFPQQSKTDGRKIQYWAKGGDEEEGVLGQATCQVAEYDRQLINKDMFSLWL